MTAFLYIFQPSGISHAAGNKFLICLGFGISGALGYFIYEFAFSQLLKSIAINWTYGKWLWYSLGVLFFISLANFLYARYLIFGFMDWSLFPYMIKGTLMFGIPILTMIMVFFWQEEKKYQGIANEINANPTKRSTPNLSKEKTIFNIPIHQIRYVEALQNYITIGYLTIDGQFKKQTERATLKSILQEIEGSTIIRTHRSFLVNQQSILDTAGNSQGLLLTLADTDKKVPVSRSYVPVFRKA